MNPTVAEDEFEALRSEIAQMKREGRQEDVLRLHATLKQQVRSIHRLLQECALLPSIPLQIDEKYRAQLAEAPKVSGAVKSSSSRHRSSVDRRDRHRSLEMEGLDSLPPHIREHAERRRRTEDSPRRSLGPPMTDSQRKVLMKGLSDERAIYHMEQSHRKSGILHHKLSLGEGTFHQEELTNYYDLIDQYLQLEKIVATFLQKTSEDYEKARSIGDRDTRKQYLESVKAAWDLRKPQEKAARDAARDAFLRIKHILEGHLQSHSARSDL